MTLYEAGKQKFVENSNDGFHHEDGRVCIKVGGEWFIRTFEGDVNRGTGLQSWCHRAHEISPYDDQQEYRDAAWKTADRDRAAKELVRMYFGGDWSRAAVWFNKEAENQ